MTLTPPRYACCEHCTEEPEYHDENPRNSHDTWCTHLGCEEGRKAFRGKAPDDPA